MEFYFDIKAREAIEGDSFSKWGWPPIWSGRIEAFDSKDARRKIEDEYNQKFIMKDSEKNKERMFLLSIKPMSSYLAKRFEPIQCSICGNEYTANEAYLIGIRDARFCSHNCKREYEATIEVQKINENSINFQNYSNPPVIYCIEYIPEQKFYIGKSIRSFTLRWWEHIKAAKVFDSPSNKFHLALKNSKLTDWRFKVIETVEYPEDVKSYLEMDRHILKRETFWMNEYNSIKNGYNTLESLKKEADKLQIELTF